MVWTADNRTLFYSVEDEETKRQFQVFRHVVGRPQAEDVLVYEEADERFNVGVGRTRDKKYMVLESASHTTSEAQFLPADQPEGRWTLIEPRKENIEYSADHRDGLWYIRVNDTARTFRIVTAPVATPGRAHWRELMAHRDDVMLEDLELFQSFAVLEERFDGLPHLRILNFDPQGAFAGPSPQIAFPEPTYSAHPHVNREFVTDTFRYGYTSLVSPTSVYEYNVLTNQSTLLKELEVPGGFDRSLYRSERLFATAPDGTKIPVSLVYRKDKKGEGTNPLYIYGYGSYGYALPVGFNSNRLSLLDRGFVLAYAHIRGGGDMGKPLARCRAADEQDEHLHRFHRHHRISDCPRLWRPAPRRHGRRQRRRIADGRGGQPAAGSLPRCALPRALRGRDEHHARSHACR